MEARVGLRLMVFLIIKLLCNDAQRLLSVLNHDVFISKLRKLQIVDNRLEWVSLDKEKFQNSKEVQKI